MIEFLTLFLGLTTGWHTVELNVVGPVAAVEVRLDGEHLTDLTAAPWVLEIDLGARPIPHELVAIARDGQGREIDRAEQWINMAPRQSVATLAVSTDGDGQPRALRVDWQSIGTPEPEQIEASFNGQPLQVTDPEHIPLPAHDLKDLHFASAEVEFSDEESSWRETEFGGARVHKVSTELTAVVVDLMKRSGLPSVAKMRSWFLKKDKPLEIHGVEKGVMDLIVVRVPGVQEVLDQLARVVIERNIHDPLGKWRNWDPATFFAGSSEAIRERAEAHGQLLDPLRSFAPFSNKVRIRFMSPTPGVLTPSGLTPEMFVHSRTYAGSEGGLSWLAQQQPPMSFAPQVREAVALAGMRARAGNQRRAVLLITAGGNSESLADTSEFSAADTRGLLDALQVPLYVWSFGDESSASEEWGQVTHLGDLSKPQRTLDRLERAATELQRDLKNQRVVWLEGRHLPQQIELSARAGKLRLVGSG